MGGGSCGSSRKPRKKNVTPFLTPIFFSSRDPPGGVPPDPSCVGPSRTPPPGVFKRSLLPGGPGAPHRRPPVPDQGAAEAHQDEAQGPPSPPPLAPQCPWVYDHRKQFRSIQPVRFFTQGLPHPPFAKGLWVVGSVGGAWLSLVLFVSCDTVRLNPARPLFDPLTHHWISIERIYAPHQTIQIYAPFALSLGFIIILTSRYHHPPPP